jgi:hypothetical protein
MRRTRDRHSLPKQNKGHLARVIQLVALAAIMSLISAGIAIADNINDTIDSSGPVTLTAGDPSPTNNTARVFVVANAGGETGCDIDAGETLTITFVTPAGITASPASVNFTGCGAANSGQFHTVAFSASSSAVSGNVTATITANSTGTASTTYNNNVSIPITVNQPPPPSDSTPPSIEYVLDPSSPDGSNGWYKSDVSLTWNVSEPESPGSLVKTGCVDQNITSDQQEQTYSCSASSDGGSAGPVEVSIKRDATAPTGVSGSPDRGPDNNGWYNSPVGFSFTGQDATSGIASCSAPTYSGPDGESVTVSGNCTDNAGNQSAAVNSSTIDYDVTAPTDIAFVGGPAAGSQHYFGSVPPAPTCSASDATSGLAGCVVTGYSSAVGNHILTATATDNAGNQSTAQRSYTVLAWTLSGYYQPVDMGIWNTVKGGSTVPLKFEVFAGPTELTSTSVVKSFTTKSVTCPGASAPTDEIEFVTTGGTNLRYDSTAGQFIQNWQTPKKPGSCHTVTMETQDGTKISANFILK